MFYKYLKFIIVIIFLFSFSLKAIADSDDDLNLSRMSDCYISRLQDKSIVCSLCGTENRATEDDCTSGNIYDDLTCSCIPAGTNCANVDDIEAIAEACRRNSSDNFYNYNYCVCVDKNTWDRVTVTPATSGSNNFFGDISSKVFFSTNFDGSVDDLSELIRLLLIAFFMVIAIVALFLGIYGMYVYSTAGEDDEKVQKAQKIFKNAIIGLAIAVFGVVIVQVIAIVFGVSDGLFDLSFNISSSP